MIHTEIIKAIMRKKRVTQEEIARALGLSTSATVSRRLSRKNSTIMNIVDILDVLGYEMVIRPAKKGPLAKNEYVLHYCDYEGED